MIKMDRVGFEPTTSADTFFTHDVSFGVEEAQELTVNSP